MAVGICSIVQRKGEAIVGDVQDVPLLSVHLGQNDHALQHLHRRLVDRRESKRSPPKLVQGEELSDCSLGRKLVDAREHLVPPLVADEHKQRQVFLGVCRIHSPAGAC